MKKRRKQDLTANKIKRGQRRLFPRIPGRRLFHTWERAVRGITAEEWTRRVRRMRGCIRPSGRKTFTDWERRADAVRWEEEE